ncbi:MAG: hypothetical protein IJL52_11265 [Clostridia bacterium]|nr:hypothetical protein [Clostridia bacterium]
MTNEKRIYTIATAHLDTVWNWDFEHVLSTCIPATIYDNLRLFEQYPTYRFNFEGAYRYALMEEYDPEGFEKVRAQVDAGNWNVTGSSYENGDVNVPSPESLLRNILYGNRFFRQNFGKTSNDIFLPDCFGFGWALPSVAAHAGLLGFSTQKLSWGSAYGIPFDVGVWTGPDGRSIFAALNAKSYCTVFKNVRTNPDLLKKLNDNAQRFSLPWTFAYHGVGDVGGAPKEESVATVCREMSENDSQEIKVLSASPTEFFNDLAALSTEQKTALPRWETELLMTNHGAGAYTSRAFSKRMNRRNEELADMAERSAVMAEALCDAPYPKAVIDAAWKTTIAHTFHDDLTGTSVERVYQRSWNDYLVAENRLAGAFEGAASVLAKNMDTSWTRGVAAVVFNALEQPRKGVVDVTIPDAGYPCVRVFERDGREVPSQVNSIKDGRVNACFFAETDALGCKVYDILYSYQPCGVKSSLRCGGTAIENEKYVVSLNERGDIFSILDKSLGGQELLKKPIRFELYRYTGDKSYPAWELTYREVTRAPAAFAQKGEIEVLENGPVRVTLGVRQTAGNSTFSYRVSLTEGGQWVSVQNEVEWREFCTLLQNGFCFTAENREATYDLGLGVIRRPTATKKMYAVPAQKWADLTDEKSSFGISVFSDSKYGWVKPDKHTLRLTVVHTPKHYYRNDSVQGMMDFGLNRYGYAIYSHGGAFGSGTQFGARCFQQPMVAFLTGNHPGALGSKFSFGGVNKPNVILRAMKKAEDSEDVIVRFNEGCGTAVQNVMLALGDGILAAREVNGMEEELGEATVENGRLVFSMAPFEIKTFALTLANSVKAAPALQQSVELPFNANCVSGPNSVLLPTVNACFPRTLFPQTVDCAGVRFALGDPDGNNLLACHGQTLPVEGDRLYLLAASLYGDKRYTFKVGRKAVDLKVQALNERIGGWDLYHLGQTAFIKPDRVAWECTHTETPQKKNLADSVYFFMYELNTAGAFEVTLPEDSGLVLLAATQVFDKRTAAPGTPITEQVERRTFDYSMSNRERAAHEKQMQKYTKTPNQS